MQYQFAVFSFVLSFFLPPLAHSQPLKVCATVPELGSLVREIGGDQVAVIVFAKGSEDPHFVVPKPSFIKAMNQCHAYIQEGLDLETGWAPALINSARNQAILPGRQGYIDASVVITPLHASSTTLDRSMGDVHALGSPHFLLSPMNGLRVARLVRDRFTALRPGSGSYFGERYADFRRRLGLALVGEALYHKYDFEKLGILAERGRLGQFLTGQNDASLLGGWLGTLHPHHNAKIVADHTIWPYFAQLFRLQLIAYLEPLPGIPPTTSHLQTVIELMQANNVKAVLASAYYDPRYAQFVAKHTGARVVNMAHQANARPGTENYLDMIDYNVKQLSAALEGAEGEA
jgi:zinc/manganese transport system substrate-binding protein